MTTKPHQIASGAGRRMNKSATLLETLTKLSGGATSRTLRAMTGFSAHELQGMLYRLMKRGQVAHAQDHRYVALPVPTKPTGRPKRPRCHACGQRMPPEAKDRSAK